VGPHLSKLDIDLHVSIIFRAYKNNS
jgi:hypothetical protein